MKVRSPRRVGARSDVHDDISASPPLRCPWWCGGSRRLRVSLARRRESDGGTVGPWSSRWASRGSESWMPCWCSPGSRGLLRSRMARSLLPVAVSAHALSVVDIELCAAVGDLDDVIGVGGPDGAALVAELAGVLPGLGEHCRAPRAVCPRGGARGFGVRSPAVCGAAAHPVLRVLPRRFGFAAARRRSRRRRACSRSWQDWQAPWPSPGS